MSLTLAEIDEGRTPDFVEPVEAWRVWRVGMCEGRVVLKSLFSSTVWEPNAPLAAVCRSVRRSRWLPRRSRAHDHAAPALGCRCGIYGVQSLSAARQYIDCAPFPYRDDRVIGRVALWGDVVEGTLGWRATFAYPVELYLRDPTGEMLGLRGRARVEQVMAALEAYRVPVDLVAPSAIAVY